MKKTIFFLLSYFLFHFAEAQTKWINLDASFQPLPSSFHVFKSIDSLDERPNVMYYAIADLKNKNLNFITFFVLKYQLFIS